MKCHLFDSPLNSSLVYNPRDLDYNICLNYGKNQSFENKTKTFHWFNNAVSNFSFRTSISLRAQDILCIVETKIDSNMFIIKLSAFSQMNKQLNPTEVIDEYEFKCEKLNITVIKENNVGSNCLFIEVVELNSCESPIIESFYVIHLVYDEISETFMWKINVLKFNSDFNYSSCSRHIQNHQFWSPCLVNCCINLPKTLNVESNFFLGLYCSICNTSSLFCVFITSQKAQIYNIHTFSTHLQGLNTDMPIYIDSDQLKQSTIIKINSYSSLLNNRINTFLYVLLDYSFMVQCGVMKLQAWDIVNFEPCIIPSLRENYTNSVLSFYTEPLYLPIKVQSNIMKLKFQIGNQNFGDAVVIPMDFKPNLQLLIPCYSDYVIVEGTLLEAKNVPNFTTELENFSSSFCSILLGRTFSDTYLNSTTINFLFMWIVNIHSALQQSIIYENTTINSSLSLYKYTEKLFYFIPNFQINSPDFLSGLRTIDLKNQSLISRLSEEIDIDSSDYIDDTSETYIEQIIYEFVVKFMETMANPDFQTANKTQLWEQTEYFLLNCIKSFEERGNSNIYSYILWNLLILICNMKWYSIHSPKISVHNIIAYTLIKSFCTPTIVKEYDPNIHYLFQWHYYLEKTFNLTSKRNTPLTSKIVYIYHTKNLNTVPSFINKAIPLFEAKYRNMSEEIIPNVFNWIVSILVPTTYIIPNIKCLKYILYKDIELHNLYSKLEKCMRLYYIRYLYKYIDAVLSVCSNFPQFHRFVVVLNYCIMVESTYVWFLLKNNKKFEKKCSDKFTKNISKCNSFISNFSKQPEKNAIFSYVSRTNIPITNSPEMCFFVNKFLFLIPLQKKADLLVEELFKISFQTVTNATKEANLDSKLIITQKTFEKFTLSEPFEIQTSILKSQCENTADYIIALSHLDKSSTNWKVKNSVQNQIASNIENHDSEPLLPISRLVSSIRDTGVEISSSTSRNSPCNVINVETENFVEKFVDTSLYQAYLSKLTSTVYHLSTNFPKLSFFDRISLPAVEYNNKKYWQLTLKIIITQFIFYKRRIVYLCFENLPDLFHDLAEFSHFYTTAKKFAIVPKDNTSLVLPYEGPYFEEATNQVFPKIGYLKLDTQTAATDLLEESKENALNLVLHNDKFSAITDFNQEKLLDIPIVCNSIGYAIGLLLGSSLYQTEMTINFNVMKYRNLMKKNFLLLENCLNRGIPNYQCFHRNNLPIYMGYINDIITIVTSINSLGNELENEEMNKANDLLAPRWEALFIKVERYQNIASGLINGFIVGLGVYGGLYFESADDLINNIFNIVDHIIDLFKNRQFEDFTSRSKSLINTTRFLHQRRVEKMVHDVRASKNLKPVAENLESFKLFSYHYRTTLASFIFACALNLTRKRSYLNLFNQEDQLATIIQLSLCLLPSSLIDVITKVRNYHKKKLRNTKRPILSDIYTIFQNQQLGGLTQNSKQCKFQCTWNNGMPHFSSLRNIFLSWYHNSVQASQQSDEDFTTNAISSLKIPTYLSFTCYFALGLLCFASHDPVIAQHIYRNIDLCYTKKHSLQCNNQALDNSKNNYKLELLVFIQNIALGLVTFDKSKQNLSSCPESLKPKNIPQFYMESIEKSLGRKVIKLSLKCNQNQNSRKSALKQIIENQNKNIELKKPPRNPNSKKIIQSLITVKADSNSNLKWIIVPKNNSLSQIKQLMFKFKQNSTEMKSKLDSNTTSKNYENISDVYKNLYTYTTFENTSSTDNDFFPPSECDYRLLRKGIIPGAYIGLGLHYFDSNQSDILNSNVFLNLDMHSDCLFYKIQAKNLICWNQIAKQDLNESVECASFRWLEQELLNYINKSEELHGLALASCFLSYGIKFAGSCSSDHFNWALKILNLLCKYNNILQSYSMSYSDSIDTINKPSYESLITRIEDTELLTFIVTMILTSVVLIMAGTNNNKVNALVKKLLFWTAYHPKKSSISLFHSPFETNKTLKYNKYYNNLLSILNLGGGKLRLYYNDSLCSIIYLLNFIPCCSLYTAWNFSFESQNTYNPFQDVSWENFTQNGLTFLESSLLWCSYDISDGSMSNKNLNIIRTSKINVKSEKFIPVNLLSSFNIEDHNHVICSLQESLKKLQDTPDITPAMQTHLLNALISLSVLNNKISV